MSRRYRLVLFDLDGTLVDSAPDLCQALAHALTEVSLPTHDVDAVRKMIGEGQRVLVERAIRKAGGDLALLDDVLVRFRRYYSEHLVEKTTVYPGVESTLSTLSKKLPLGVATNKPGAWARQIVETLGLSQHFVLVLGEDDVGARKPDPRLLLQLCERIGVDKAETLMVGDSAIDQAAAAAAGMDLALCLYGFGDYPMLTQSQQAHPEPGNAKSPYLLKTFPELLPVLAASLEGI